MKYTQRYIFLATAILVLFIWGFWWWYFHRIEGGCSKSNQHVLVLDAGSTGSRIHVFEFSFCGSQPKLELELYFHRKPGLSQFSQAEDAAASLDPLLEEAQRHLPQPRWSCTPLAVKATAGLRLLGAAKSDEILQAVQRRIQQKFPFRLVKSGILDGKDEGVYAWMSVNYLLNRLQEKGTTAAIIDLGGGSTQIVFAPHLTDSLGQHRYDIHYGSTHHLLYQHSYLGYGLMEARKKMSDLVLRGSPKTLSLRNKCLLKGFPPPPDSDQAPDQCRKVIKDELFKKDCPVSPAPAPCAFAGIYQPDLNTQFPSSAEIYAFSYVYDRYWPLLQKESFMLKELKPFSDLICQGQWDGLAPDALEEAKTNANYCFDLMFIYALLKDGYGLAENRPIRTAKKIDGVEVSWCVGAALIMLEEEQLCSD